MTLKKAVITTFRNLPIGTFSGAEFLDSVRAISGLYTVFDDTILRKLRKLRQQGLIHYHCVNVKNSIYYKEPDN